MIEASVVYRSIIRLTETRDVQNVNLVFQEILQTLINGPIALYMLKRIGRENRFELASEQNPFGDEIENLLALFNPQQGVRAEIPKDLRPFPLASVNGLHAVLVVDRKAKIQDEVFLNFLISVYCNQFNLVEMSSYDALTGLMNRGEFDKKIYQLMAQKNESSRASDQDAGTSALAILDIDNFKQVNDKYGHLYGDEVLLLLGRQLQKHFRDEDWLFRYGGEEFAIVLRNVTPEQSALIFERARKGIEEFIFPQVGQITVSIGFTSLSGMEVVSACIAKADSALYYSKNNGRNQVHCYQNLVEAGELTENAELTGEISLF